MLDLVTDQVIAVAMVLADIEWRYQDISDHDDVEMFLGLREVMITEALQALAEIEFEAVPIIERAGFNGRFYARIRLELRAVAQVIYPALFDAIRRINGNLYFEEDSMLEWLVTEHVQGRDGARD